MWYQISLVRDCLYRDKTQRTCSVINKLALGLLLQLTRFQGFVMSYDKRDVGKTGLFRDGLKKNNGLINKGPDSLFLTKLYNIKG